MAAGSELALPGGFEERVAYAIEGSLGCGAERADIGGMLVFGKEAKVVLRTKQATLIVLPGGAPLGGNR